MGRTCFLPNRHRDWIDDRLVEGRRWRLPDIDQPLGLLFCLWISLQIPHIRMGLRAVCIAGFPVLVPLAFVSGGTSEVKVRVWVGEHFSDCELPAVLIAQRGVPPSICWMDVFGPRLDPQAPAIQVGAPNILITPRVSSE